MTPAAYFDEMVLPTIKEFEDSPADVRRAYAACMFAYHFADAVLVHDGPYATRGDCDTALGAIRDSIAAQAKFKETFWKVAAVATLAKHLEVTRGRKEVPRLEIRNTHVGQGAFVDDGRYLEGVEGSRSWANAPDVVRNRDDHGDPIDVLSCVRQTHRAIVAYLTSRPELGWSPPPEQQPDAGSSAPTD